jgi:hypothetical protein
MLRYSRVFGAFRVGAEGYAGRDSFGQHFSRIGAFFSYAGIEPAMFSSFDDNDMPAADSSAELFVEAGYSAQRIKAEPDENVFLTDHDSGAHVGLGARRAVSDRSDLGVRLELDDVQGHTLLSVRMLDYRYRFGNPLALNVFVGASRYDWATPAFGLYFGAGVQWRDIFPGWDIGIDARDSLKVARDYVLPNEPAHSPRRPDAFYSITSFGLTLTKRF